MVMLKSKLTKVNQVPGHSHIGKSFFILFNTKKNHMFQNKFMNNANSILSNILFTHSIIIG